MSVRIQLISPDLDDERLDELSRDFFQEASRLEGINITPPSHTVAAGKRGDAVTVGVFLITFLTSGSMAALFKILKSYVERNQEIEIDINKPNHSNIRIKLKNVTAEQFQDIMDAVR